MSESSEISDNSQNISKRLNPAERILLLLAGASDGEPIPGNLWLQKEMYLISKNLSALEDFLEYEPNVQGPYSESVNNIMEDLALRGLIQKEGADIQPTSRGDEVIEELNSQAKEPLTDLVEDVKDMLNDLTKDELLVYIYYTHENMTEESLELEELEQDREEIARSLYRKGKISREKASELAGVPLHEFKV